MLLQQVYVVFQVPRLLKSMGLVVSDVRRGPYEATFRSPEAAFSSGFAVPTGVFMK